MPGWCYPLCVPILTTEALVRFLFKPRRWWLPLRLVGWGYAYFIVGFVFVVCVLLTLALFVSIVGGY